MHVTLQLEDPEEDGRAYIEEELDQGTILAVIVLVVDKAV